MKFICKLSLVLFGLIIVMCLPFIQVQAAEDELQEYEFCLSFYINKTDGSTDEYGGNPFSVSGKDIKVYSLGSLFPKDTRYGEHMSISLTSYAFSPFPFVHSLSTSECNKVEIDGKTIYYRSIYGFMAGHDLNSFDSFTYSGVPNVTMYSEDKDLDAIAQNIAEEMAAAGFYDYDDSKWATDREQFSYFSLSGFQYDDSISASWSGILTDLQLIKDHIGDVEVVVSPSFFLILEPGEKYQEFKEPESLVIPLDEDFSRSYDSFFEGNPYKGRALLTLDFYPRYYDSATGCMYRGDSITVRFDARGKISDVDLPEASLIPIYDPGCYFDSPSSTTVIDPIGIQKTFFRWNRVSTSYLYRSNYIAVDLGYGGKWYSYSANDFFSSNSISVTWKQVKDLLKDYIDDGFSTSPVVTDGYKIRYTPYYKTDSGVYYGKPIVISVAGNATTESITELDGDYLDDINPPEFVDKTPHDWFEDTSLWDNVDHVVDHIKDDTAGTVDLDNLSFNFFKMLKAVINACGQFPALVSTVFSFLPADISRLLVISLSLIIILRILGR